MMQVMHNMHMTNRSSSGLNRKPRAVIFGCGNPLLGDDGFGPAVINELIKEKCLPDDVSALDVGTAIRDYLFDYLLSEELRPEYLFIVDAVEFKNREAGELFTIDPFAIPAKKIHDFSLHQFPTVNMLQELEEHTDIKVVILVVQIKSLPQQVSPGFSSAVEAAIPQACETIIDILSSTESEVTVQ